MIYEHIRTRTSLDLPFILQTLSLILRFGFWLFMLDPIFKIWLDLSLTYFMNRIYEFELLKFVQAWLTHFTCIFSSGVTHTPILKY